MRRRVRLAAALLMLLSIAGPARAEEALLPAVERIELENGVVLLLVEKHEVPLVSVEALLQGGAVTDPDGLNGMASLLAGLMTQGAGGRDAAAFAEAVESVGGELSVGADLESIVASGEFLARDAALMVGLLADLLRRPALEATELDKLRDREISFIRAAKDADPGELMPVYAHAFIYGAHPYGNPVSGDEMTLAAITLEDVVGYYDRHVGADRLILAVAGDFETASMRALLTEAFGDWTPAGTAREPLREPVPARGGQVLLIDKPGATQTYFWLGNVGVARDYPRRAELDLANTLFGGRFTSMLNTRLRVESGLTYGASSQLVQPTLPGTVAIRSFTRTDATIEAIDMAQDVLSRFHDSAPAPEAIDSARNYVLGRYPTHFETAAQLAAQFAMLEFYGLERDTIDGYGAAIASVTAEPLLPVIDTVYPARDELVFVILGDAAVIREPLGKYGTVTEMPITAPSFDPPSY